MTGSPDFLLPEAQIANLDAGNLVAGSTRWDSDGDGIFFNETRVGFLWSPASGAQVFAIPENLYGNPTFYFPSAISDTGSVSGTALFRLQRQALPFLWTAGAGVQFLSLPCHGPPPTVTGGPSTACSGSTTGLSANGAAVAGQVIDGEGNAHAARWKLGGGRPGDVGRAEPDARGAGGSGVGSLRPKERPLARPSAQRDSPRRSRFTLEQLDTAAPWSDGLAISADGRVVVGEIAPEGLDVTAARWIDGVAQALEPVGDASSAVQTSADGGVALGWGFVDGRLVLVRWDAQGDAQLLPPPEGWSLETIRASNRAATAAVGALSLDGNWAPYVWTHSGGFRILPELGREGDYDQSEAIGLSEDGHAVVGALQASVISNGDPPSLAFLWTADGGLFTLNDLLATVGFPDPDFFSALAISGDGRRILATGNPGEPAGDTNSLILTLAP